MSNIKSQQILSSLYLIDIEIYLGDQPLPTDEAIDSLHPTTCTHWILYINLDYFDSNGCSPPQQIPRFNRKRNVHCSLSEQKIQGLDSYCAA